MADRGESRSMRRYESWGRYPRNLPARIVSLPWAGEPLSLADPPHPLLAYGRGRSYGDCCQNGGGTLLDTAALCRFIAFDRDTGVLRCEAGVTLADILRLVVPQRWFPHVLPGTKFVTVGGAIANDIHGKNHHRAGTFGRYVRAMELQRSTGERIRCSLTENTGLFRASIGGLGLTGLILWAEIALKRVAGPALLEERVRFAAIDEFFELSAESDSQFDYTVAWIDARATGRHLGRGVFIRGNHAPDPAARVRPARDERIGVPWSAPDWLLNGLTTRWFNAGFYRAHRATVTRRLVHYDRFFHPLDGIRHWNRLYGRRGFVQYQCVIPPADAGPVLRAILECSGTNGRPSFLAVLKRFGDLESPGLLSFPRAGFTLALDFPFEGPPTLQFLDQLDDIVRGAGGAVYPAKDGRMSPRMFRASFPNLPEFVPFLDPGFSSSFWRRVMPSGGSPS